jgi:hypothetical protein
MKIPAREKASGFFLFGYAQGFGWWERGYPDALWNDTRMNNAEQNLKSRAE